MNARRLGRTGLKVSEICLGTMTFGHQGDEKTSFAIMDRATEAGVNFIDTADVYPCRPRWRPRAAPKRSSAPGSRANAIGSCWPPSAGSGSATGPTTRASRGATS